MRLHNVHDVSVVNLRSLYQKTRSDTLSMTMSNLTVTSLSLRNLYNKFSKEPDDFIELFKPTVLSLALRNLYNKLDTRGDSLSISLPSIAFLEVRPLLQKLHTWGLDETLKITAPNNIEIHKKDVVTLYDNPDIVDFKIDIPEPLEFEVKNIVNKNTQREPGFEVSLPDAIELGGSVKPVLTFPVLEGEIINDSLAVLTWDDSSITHTGYLIYKSLEPIPVNTTQEPYIQLGRDVKQFDDSVDMPPNATIYYRVTPSTVYGNLFSNQLELLTHTSKIITFIMQESPTYTPIRVDNNIIPLVPDIDIMWDGLNASFEQMSVLDMTLMSKYIPTPTYIEMRIYNESA